MDNEGVSLSEVGGEETPGVLHTPFPPENYLSSIPRRVKLLVDFPSVILEWDESSWGALRNLRSPLQWTLSICKPFSTIVLHPNPPAYKLG